MKTIFLLLTLSFMVSMSLPAINDIKDGLTSLFYTTTSEKVDDEMIDIDAQIAILLDTSNSMDGLIEQAKSQLWNIVNELSEAKKKDEPIRFQIALYEYGNDNISSSNSYVRQVVDFTTDIDLISQKLFSLRTNGGEEYCGAAIRQSIKQLNWSTLANLKTIYIAGNESFAQGRTSYVDACDSAIERNVIVNTIFCGPLETGINLEWRTSARMTNGNYFNIDQNQTTRYYGTPYDDEISDLNESLNDTYIHYGTKGQDFLNNQKTQDDNAKIYGRSNYASRSVYKSKKNYNNAKWDLVDAYEKDDNIIEEAKELPQEYKDLSKDDLEKKVKIISKKRKSIQSKIRELANKRKKHIESLKKNNKEESSLDQSINKSIRSQAKKVGLTYDTDANEKAAIIDYNAFYNATGELQKYREERKIDSDQFIAMSKDEKTIILDTRSKSAYDERHVIGSIHLNFSDFTEEKLNALIPDKNTRILIYCNNNFISESAALVLKAPALALNIPTFINLHGYGYKNIYELQSLLIDDDRIIEMSSTKK